MTRELREKIDAAPKTPGCYLFYDNLGNIIYVGKSKLLANRVRSYFHESAKDDERVWKLVREIRDVTYISTRTELDALMLEYRLIKLHKPWFNSQHVRDLQRPYLRIDFNAVYPTLSIASEKLDDDAEYYGAFDDRFDAREAIELLNAVWKTPLCGKTEFGEDARPCLYHGMGKCCAPCNGIIRADAYGDAIKDAARLLSGQYAMAVEALWDEMLRLSAQMRFEQAAAIKEMLSKLERLRRKCRHRFRIMDETNAFVFMKVRGEQSFTVFFICGGKAMNRVDFPDTVNLQAAEDFMIAALKKRQVLTDADWIPGCLMEIFADKELVQLPAKPTRRGITNAFWEGARALAVRITATNNREDSL